MLSVESKGLQLYNVFRNKRFFKRTKKLTDIIHRNNIKTCQSIKDVKPSVIASKKKQNNKTATRHKVLDIAKAR